MMIMIKLISPNHDELQLGLGSFLM
jgi:hypothetical protein